MSNGTRVSDAGLKAAKEDLAHCVDECGASSELLRGPAAELAAHNLAIVTDDRALKRWLRCYRRSLRQVGMGWTIVLLHVSKGFSAS